MKKQILLLSAVIANTLIFSNAYAKSNKSDVIVSSNVAITSNYVDRGVSLSNDSPAVQGGFDVIGRKGGFFGGVWASSRGDVDPESGAQIATMETQVYAGVAFNQNDIKMDIGVQGTYFPHDNDKESMPDDVMESFIGMEYQMFRGEIWYDNEGTELYKQLELNLELLPHLGLNVTAGHTNYLEEDKESTINKQIGLAAQFKDFVLSVSVSQHDDNDSNVNEITLSRSF